jgi:hypothetical protein
MRRMNYLHRHNYVIHLATERIDIEGANHEIVPNIRCCYSNGMGMALL